MKGNYAGTRCWDAMYAALNMPFGPTNDDEQRYLVAMTDGNDDSSLLNTNADPVADHLMPWRSPTRCKSSAWPSAVTSTPTRCSN